MAFIFLRGHPTRPIYCLLKPFIVLSFLVLAGLLTAEISSAQVFHGTFSESSNVCESCHSSGRQSMLNDPQELCLNCHDESLDSKGVLSSFGFDGRKYVKISRHKVPEGLMACGDCHSPHVDISYSPALLKVKGKRVSRGSEFCLACHGVDPSSSGISAGGDHESGYLGVGAHDTKPTWTSPSGIKCANCHLSHGSANERLVGFRGKGEKAFNEEKLCFTCHGSSSPSSLRGWTILDQFTLPSHHPLLSNQAKVECTSCHNPHFVQAEAGKMMSDPDNTQNLISDNIVFCLRCHDGSPPAALTTTDTVVPFTVKFSKENGPFFPGWDISGYASTPSGHYLKGYTCLNCHHPHGSRNARLVALNLNNSLDSSEEKLCLACHRSGGPAGAADIASELQRANVHPVQKATGLHSSLEDFSSLSYFKAPLNSRRHAECTDCHNPHFSSIATASAPAASGKLKGVGGVNKDGKAIKSIRFEYELCFKCHSSYAILPPGQGDKLSEFSQANGSYHPVVGLGKNRNIRTGAWVSPWSSESLVYCSSCHGSDSGGPGVHGSSYPQILRRPYEREGGSDSGEICFACHNYSTYVGESPSADTRFAAHYQMTGKANLSCQACHLTHGSRQPHLMADSFTVGNVTRKLNYSHSDTGGSCSPSPDSGCHQLRSYTSQY